MPLKTAIKYAGAWSILVFFIVLLTLIFSFLGTICCAVLAGMMLGPSKFARWQALLVSLLFPTVIFIVLHSSRAELLGRQIALLSLLCFVAFWLTYVVMAVVAVYERKESAAAKARRAQPAMAAGTPKSAQPASAARQAQAASGAGLARSPARLTLELLQGRWSFQNNGGGERPEQKILEVDREELLVRVTQPDGRVAFVAKGQMRLCPFGASGVPAICPARTEADADTVVSI